MAEQDFPVHRDARGELVVMERTDIGFDVARVFTVTGTDGGGPRGGHRATCLELLVLVAGRVVVTLGRDGAPDDEHDLRHPGASVTIDRGTHVDYELDGTGSVIVVLCDAPYSSPRMTRASVLVPIHDKPTTLPLTIDTVLRQSVEDLEVLLIGDGVTDEVRAVVEGLVATDERVRFLDFPKGPHHGERYRHDAIEAARSDAIFYLCDDDLLLPDHVADLLDLLADHSFVQSLNGEVLVDGQVRFYAADLGDPAVVAMHLRDDLRFCSVSITGTAHTRALYDAVGDPWDTTPAGWWPDHWQFRKLMRHPSYAGATSSRMTALQFPTSSGGRDTWTAEARVAELRPWHRLVVAPGAQDDVDARCEDGRRAQLVEERTTIALIRHDVAWLRSQHEEQSDDLRWLQEKYAEHEELVELLSNQLDEQVRLTEAAEAARSAEATGSAEATKAAEAVRDRLRAKIARKNRTIARLRAEVRALRARGTSAPPSPGA